ncbi:Protein phosphatase 2C family protein [Abeliophyllum distichum]|uniref:Protein phosphatase 2C family protein n=1 Tax=Abeliophyllum distichum TaxID=126358 RepID=A0ABD1TDD3_9LAMI
MNLIRCILFSLLGFILCVNTVVTGESPTCLTVYREGGAPAVFQSPKCPRWKLANYNSDSKPHSQSPTATCQSAMHQGRRKSQEDRVLCALDIRIPFPGANGVKEVTVGIMAVFDGHNGAEASEMASKLLLEYFILHTYFLLDTTYSILSRKWMGTLPNTGDEGLVFQKPKLDEELDLGRFKVTLSEILDGFFPFEILREALLRAIHDIDASFSKDASRNNVNSGSTATIILVADTQILVANIGDSKAFLCSEVYQSPSEAKATLLRIFRQRRNDGAPSPLKEYRSLKSAASNGWMFLMAKELTRDHHPDRDDERSRVESFGGHISNWGGVARVNGQLAVSRAIGDIHFKSYGVISVPEVTDWLPLTVNDSYLVAASDGVFENLSPQDVCDKLWEPYSDITVTSESSSSCSYSLADCIVNTAFEKGSMDNLAATILPLRSLVPFQTLLKDRSDREETFDYSSLGYQKQTDDNLGNDNTSALMGLEHSHPVIAKFDRLLVEGKHSNFGCFYLSENLDVNDDYTFWVQKDDQESIYDLSHALPGGDFFCCNGPLNLYSDQRMHVHYGTSVDGDKDQCINSDNFARFLGFLESIPFYHTGLNDHGTPDSRYILKKRFDRGSYGEVWLAFQWNCSQVDKASERRHKEKNIPPRTVHLGAYDENFYRSLFSDDCNASSSGHMFILKRIMVERGVAVYLSGLREKYFGEIFLNASTSLSGSLSVEVSDFSWKKTRPEVYGFMQTNKSVEEETEDPLSLEDRLFRKKRKIGAAFEEGLNHIARYVESFESRSNEIWLVFCHEGVSLSKLLYTAEEVVPDADKERDEHRKRVQILHPSKWWHWLKTTEVGQEEMRNIIWQLLMALKSCHDRNITHRDIKPENMIICFEDEESGRCLRESPTGDKNYTTKMRIIDFGSAMDEFTVKHLYGSVGPSRDEQTSEYAPPEAFLNVSWYRAPSSITVKYDMWSVGVVILELILGSPNAFQINAKTRALLDQHLEGWNESLKELAYKLRAFMEMCILIPGSSSKLHQNWGPNVHGSISPVPWKCSEEFFSYQIKSRDPLKIGFPNVLALRLVRDLLRWNPEERLTVDDALRHPYFSSPSGK